MNVLQLFLQAVSTQISQNLLFRTSTRAFATDFGEEQTGEPFEAERRTTHEKCNYFCSNFNYKCCIYFMMI